MTNLAKRVFHIRWNLENWKKVVFKWWNQEKWKELLILWSKESVKIKILTKINEIKSVDIHYHRSTWLVWCNWENCVACREFLSKTQRFWIVVFDYNTETTKLLLANVPLMRELREVNRKTWNLSEKDLILYREWTKENTKYYLQIMPWTSWNKDYFDMIKVQWFSLEEKLLIVKEFYQKYIDYLNDKQKQKINN